MSSAKLSNPSLMPSLRLFIRFALVGGSTATIGLGLTFILVEIAGLHTTLASTIACATCTVYNYLLHYHWTFSSDAPHGAVLVRYFIMCIGAIIVNALVMQAGVAWSDIHYLLVQLVAMLALICWSLTVSSLWVFR